MSFVEGLALKYESVMDQCFQEPFVQELGQGTLPDAKLKNYIVQDSIYLRSYIKSYSYALAKCQTLKEMKKFYIMLGYVDDSENLTRLDFLRQFGMTDDDVDKTPRKIQCHQYCEFLESNAKKGDIADIVVAGLPCMLGYQYVFTELKKKYPEVMNGRYASLVNDYTNESYNEFCKMWVSFANDVCEPLDEDKKKSLEEIFKQGTFHELYFWQMAGNDEETGE